MLFLSTTLSSSTYELSALEEGKRMAELLGARLILLRPWQTLLEIFLPPPGERREDIPPFCRR